jgi:hypothetical protein
MVDRAGSNFIVLLLVLLLAGYLIGALIHAPARDSATYMPARKQERLICNRMFLKEKMVFAIGKL